MGFIVKNTTLLNPIELIAPHSCRGCGSIGSPLCERCKNNIYLERQDICPNCKAPKAGHKCEHCSALPPIFAIGDRASLMGKLVHDYKYSSVRALGRGLSDLANMVLPNFIGRVVLVPLPTISRHVRERGFDHTLDLARRLVRMRDGWSVELALERARNTVQVGASETARLTQAKHAFKINPKIQLNETTTYLLLDDVWTTGASMKAANKILSKAGAKKIAMLILAISQTSR